VPILFELLACMNFDLKALKFSLALVAQSYENSIVYEFFTFRIETYFDYIHFQKLLYCKTKMAKFSEPTSKQATI